MVERRFLMSCIIVLGCYRSGTSAVAGVLHHLGVKMGNDFDKPAPSNPKGYFEDLEFKRLYDMVTQGKDVWKLIETLIKIRELENPIWGVKDPQLCLFLNKFVPLIHTEHRIISTIRSKEQICQSLAKAIAGMQPQRFAPLVDKYLDTKAKELEHYTGKVLNVEFEVLKANKETEIARIAEFVGLPVTQESLDFIGA
jgi:hypothetical protein